MKLAHALIAKSMAELILVAALAVSFYLAAFPPSIHGWGEARPHGIAGWAVNHHKPWARLQVQLFIDGKFEASTMAYRSRPDVVAAGWSKDEWHGYEFEALATPAPGRHEARVYALNSSRHGAQQTLQMVGDPIWFDVDDQGIWHPLPDHELLTRRGQ